MPILNDATVVAAAYDSFGIGSNRIIRLKNGNQYALVKNGTTDFRIYKSTDNWATAGSLFYNHGARGLEMALVTDGTYIILIYADVYPKIYAKTFSENGTNITTVTIEANLNAGYSIYNLSALMNAAGTQIHVTYSATAAEYTNTQNVKYVKGTLAANGTISFLAPEFVTAINNVSYQARHPVMMLDNLENPCIVTKFNEEVVFLTKRYTTKNVSANYATTAAWGNKSLFVGNPYFANRITGIFVPSNINGLPNGRIWAAWDATDATDTSMLNVRVIYSDDGGVTWSAIQKLTSGNAMHKGYPSLTANKDNEVYVLYQEGADVGRIRYKSGSWGSPVVITTSGSQPSALYSLDFSFKMTDPIFIYKDAAKVGIFGSYQNAEMNIVAGSSGIKTSADLNNFLTYNIAHGKASETITEKLNGITLFTKTLASGENTTIQLTEAQWDGIEYGSYRNALGDKNTITIEVGSEIFTFNFSKRLDPDAETNEIVNATNDMNEFFLSSIKRNFASNIIAKGGSANLTDPWDLIITAIGSLGDATNRKIKFGSFNTASAATYNITGLTFKPSIIFVYQNDAASASNAAFLLYVNRALYGTTGLTENWQFNGSSFYTKTVGNSTNTSFSNITETGFTLNFINWTTSWNFFYIAIE